MIKGLVVKDLLVHTDDRGWLMEVLHNYDFQKFGQIYIVGSPIRGTIRGLHRHFNQSECFCIVNGAAKWVFIQGDKETPEEYTTVVMSSRAPKAVIIPPEVWHGFIALEDNTISVSTSSEVYNATKPDEERIAYNAFEPYIGNVWAPQIK